MNTDVFYDWVAAQLPDTTWSVTFADQNGPAPEQPYVSLKVSARTRVGDPSTGQVDEYGVETLTVNIDLTLSVQVFGQTLAELAFAEVLCNSLNKSTVQNYTFRANGVAFVDYLTGVNDVSGLQGVEIEPRRQFDVRFRIAEEIEDEVGLIERVEITTKIRDTDGHVVIEKIDEIGV